MSGYFWNERYILKSRSEHICQYCYKTIKKGESYFRETGFFDDFHDYCLCERCRVVARYFSEINQSKELGNLFDDCFDGDFIKCPFCNSGDFKYIYNSDRIVFNCTCNCCKNEFTEFLTEEKFSKLLRGCLRYK